MRIGFYVTVIYVALTLGSGYITENDTYFHQIGVGDAVQFLASDALDRVAKGIGIVATTVGLALPSLQKARAKDGGAAEVPATL